VAQSSAVGKLRASPAQIVPLQLPPTAPILLFRKIGGTSGSSVLEENFESEFHVRNATLLQPPTEMHPEPAPLYSATSDKPSPYSLPRSLRCLQCKARGIHTSLLASVCS